MFNFRIFYCSLTSGCSCNFFILAMEMHNDSLASRNLRQSFAKARQNRVPHVYKGEGKCINSHFANTSTRSRQDVIGFLASNAWMTSPFPPFQTYSHIVFLFSRFVKRVWLYVGGGAWTDFLCWQLACECQCIRRFRTRSSDEDFRRRFLRSKPGDKEIFMQFSTSLNKFGYPKSLMLPASLCYV